MTVTVESILRDKIMKNSKLKAGEGGLQKQVTWIHIGEIVDMGKWLDGGEFLLTCIHGPGDDKEKQLEFLRGIAKAGGSAVGIEAGYYFDTMPDYLIKEANKVNLPLIEIPPGRPFVEITQALLPKITEALEKRSQQSWDEEITSLKETIETGLYHKLINQKFDDALEIIDDICFYLSDMRQNSRGIRFYLLQTLQTIFSASLELKADIIRVYRNYLVLYNNLKLISSPQKYLDFAAIALKDMISLVRLSTEGEYNTHIYQAFKYIFENYRDQNLKISQVASEIGVSSPHLNYLFRTEVKMPPKQVLTNIRIEAAKHFLYHTNMALNRVAARTGFSDASYFSRVFKKEVGLPPSEYRKLME
ncbi:PucR family transcriptional regulator ligand-binding domain-containing protein [Halarsenatibacter silvermanii]|uniref:AraC-type DNA-binding protein n=1 Tax=Halarsenatibacter silvermanii TaxID=321763 RepID=A0A1G9GVG6_9FIRM|nr:PucR family transcriptional regulator ligand-binding domain-containing protein [Halarsenatibacter silvermanii]SDL04679.1 AraC-type DNA-binding protein [Halarsenatibacter silvermanii]